MVKNSTCVQESSYKHFFGISLHGVGGRESTDAPFLFWLREVLYGRDHGRGTGFEMRRVVFLDELMF